VEEDRVPPMQLMKVTEARREGFEIGVRHPLGPRTAVYANFSYLDPGDVKLQTVGRKLAVGVDRRVDKWTLSGDLLYVARLYDLDQTNTLVEVPSFTVVNLKATRPLAPGLRTGIVVENLFDRDYRADPAYPYPMPGRTFRFQLETDW
jgi:outer membrane receptor protein involved in Fe transport